MEKTAFLLMIITIISKIFGFGREISLSYIHGATSISDAYLISTTIPSAIFGMVSSGIIASYIPMYSKIREIDGDKRANYFTSNLVNVLFIICTIIFILGLIFTKQIVLLFASGFEGQTLKLTIKFTKISLLAIYFTGFISVFTGFLQLKDNYIVPAIIGIPFNLIVIATIIISTKNIYFLAIGFVMANFFKFSIMLPGIYKKNYRHKLHIDFQDNYLLEMIRSALPVILGVSVNQINVLIDKTIASQIAVGGISALNYANKLNGFIQGIFVLSIVTAIYPSISKMAANNNMHGLKKVMEESIIGILLLVLPTTVGSMIFSQEIVSILFGRGAFDKSASHMTAYTLYFYSIGMVGIGLREILTRVFYSMQDTKTPMINSVVGMFLNIILNIILSQYIGIGGLALATSISAIITSGLMFISLRKKIGRIGIKGMVISTLKILFASLIMGGIAKVIFVCFRIILGSNLSLIIAIVSGVISYFVIIYFIKIEYIDYLIKTVKSKINKAVDKR